MDLQEATFVKELRGRFLCEVILENKKENCYISNSSHLSNLLDLTNKLVLLKTNNGKFLKTKYTLQAVNYDDTYLLLNLNYLNNIIGNFLEKKDLIIKREYIVHGYKTDYYILNENKIIEIKGVLSPNKTAMYTFKKHNRAYLQLKKIKELLKLGYKVDYNFILLNPKIESIKLEDKRIKENRLFIECIQLGMNVNFYKSVWCKNDFKILAYNIKKNF